MKNTILTLFVILFFVEIYAQQVVYVDGDGTSTNTTPELYVAGGETGLLYIEGGITVGGTSPKIINSGAIIIDGGNWENTSNTLIDITSPTNTYNNITGIVDLGTLNTIDDLFGGTVHLSNNYQEINGVFGTKFYNLSLDGIGNSIKELVNVDTEVSHQLFLNDEIFNLNDNILFVSNTNLGAISRSVGGSSGGEPLDLYGNAAKGMGSQNQFSNLVSGMITASGIGRLRRATTTGQGPYLFPLGTADHLIYRPIEIINSSQITSYYASLEYNSPNPTNFGSPAPTTINTPFYHFINCEAGNTGDELRIYSILADLNNISNGCTVAANSRFGIAQTSTVGYNAWIFEEGNAAGTGSGDMYHVTTSQYATNASGYTNNIPDFKAAYAIAYKILTGFVR